MNRMAKKLCAVMSVLLFLIPVAQADEAAPGYRFLRRPHAPLFTLEDRYSFHVEEADGDVCLRVNFRENPQAAELYRMLYEWQAAANALRKGEITREAYDRWRYNFPDGDTTQRWVKAPSQRPTDDLAAGLQEHADDDHE